MNGHELRRKMERLEMTYEMRAVASYQAMVDALKLARPLAIRACDDEAIAAIDKALADAGHPQS